MKSYEDGETEASHAALNRRLQTMAQALVKS